MTQSAPRDDQKLQITLLQERAAGTFARVYLAEARSSGGLSRVVAVKVIKEQWSDSHEILTRTRDEARLLARLQHKNILRVEALADIDGQPAIVMEFVDGIDLQQLIERLAAAGRRVPRRALYKIMADTASAIAAAWEEIPLNGSEPLRVVHRDVKPSNIMVSKQGELKVLDFGTARFEISDRQARTGALRFGSLKYMSPERRLGDRGEHPSDVYAMGLLCLEMLQGQMLPVMPLDPDEHDQSVHAIISQIGDLGLPDSRWDDALRQTLRAMLASDPTQRLHASQLVPLFRAFADGATGESLDVFAANTVAALTRDLYGGNTGAELSGNRVFVAMTTSSDLPVPASPAAGPPVPLLPEDPGWSEPDRPTQVSVSVTAGSYPDADLATVVDMAGRTAAQAANAPTYRAEPSGPLPVSAAPLTQQQPAYPLDNSVTRPSVDNDMRGPPGAGSPSPTDTAPMPLSRPVGRLAPPSYAADRAYGADSAYGADKGFAQSPAPGRPTAGLPQAQTVADPPTPQHSNLKVGLLAGLTVFVGGSLLLTIAALGAGVWYEFLRDDDSSPPSPAAQQDADGDGSQPLDPRSDHDALAAAVSDSPGSATSITLTIAGDGDSLQWIAIQDASGDRVFKGRPGGSVDLPAGTYSVLAKVRARSVAQASFQLEDPLDLSCQPADKGQVFCDRGDGPKLVLEP